MCTLASCPHLVAKEKCVDLENSNEDILTRKSIVPDPQKYCHQGVVDQTVSLIYFFDSYANFIT